MAKYELKLMVGKEIVDGETQFKWETRKLDFIPFVTARKILVESEKIEKLAKETNSQSIVLDKQVELIAEIFDVTTDDIFNGLDAQTAAVTIDDLFMQITGADEQIKKAQQRAKMLK